MELIRQQPLSRTAPLSSLILDPRIRHAHRIGLRCALALHTNRRLDGLAFDRKIFLLAQGEGASDDVPVVHGLDDCEPMPEGANRDGDRRDPDHIRLMQHHLERNVDGA